MYFGIIYKVTNKVNGKIYIGQTTQALRRRAQGHFADVSMNRDKSIFHKALKKYDREDFVWEILEYCSTKAELDEMEFHYIRQYNSFGPGGYNLTLGGAGVVGFSHTAATKIKISEQQLGTANSFFGKNHTDEAIKKIRESSTERTHTLEHKLAIIGNGNYFYGKTHTQEVKDKIAEANKKRVWSDASRKKLSEARKKYWAKKRGEL